MSQHKTHNQPQVHRDRHDIIKQIFQIVNSRNRGNIKSFELAYKCNLTWPQFREYRALLLRNDLLSIPSTYHGYAQSYKITPRGIRCLELIEEIEDYLRSE